LLFALTTGVDPGMSVLRVLFEVGSGNLLLLKRIMGFEISQIFVVVLSV
jgi:hypothetical protein